MKKYLLLVLISVCFTGYSQRIIFLKEKPKCSMDTIMCNIKEITELNLRSKDIIVSSTVEYPYEVNQVIIGKNHIVGITYVTLSQDDYDRLYVQRTFYRFKTKNYKIVK